MRFQSPDVILKAGGQLIIPAPNEVEYSVSLSPFPPFGIGIGIGIGIGSYFPEYGTPPVIHSGAGFPLRW